MYPYEIFLGMSLYEIFLLVGVISCFIVFRIFADKRKYSTKYTNFIITCGFIAIVVGYIASVLVQAVYNGLETGVFEIAVDTGSTFLGGLIGGAATFLLVYFVAGAFLFKDTKEHIRLFVPFTSIAGACIAVAHAFGRVGCFFAGCCYGIETDSFLGVVFEGQTVKRLPVQLFETAFLLVVFALIFVFNFKNEKFVIGLPCYMISYGIWRFFIEYLRGDDRGEFFVKFVTPSQGTSVILVIAGIIILLILLRKNGICKKEN